MAASLPGARLPSAAIEIAMTDFPMPPISGANDAELVAFGNGWSCRGYLPHFDSSAVIQSVTFRLGDSLPADVLVRLLAGVSEEVERRRRFEAMMDSGHGSCLLGRPDVAAMFESRLLFHHGERYLLHAWCIMPNHVHVLLRTFAGVPLGDIVHAWKSVSARLLAPSGVNPHGFWAPDYWDRYVRDERHWYACREYIHSNPVKAGLASLPAEWAWSSARRPEFSSAQGG